MLPIAEIFSFAFAFVIRQGSDRLLAGSFTYRLNLWFVSYRYVEFAWHQATLPFILRAIMLSGWSG